MSFLRTLLMFVFVQGCQTINHSVFDNNAVGDRGTKAIQSFFKASNIYNSNSKTFNNNSLLSRIEKINNDTKNQIYETELKNQSDYVICLRSEWKKDSEKYKEEAKNRGLVCKKNDENKILAASNQTEETSEIIKIKPLSENLARLKKDRGVSNPGQLLKTIDKINENFKIEIQEKNLKNYSDYVICLRSNWKQEFEPYQKEARNRGLTCVVKKDNKPVISSKSKNTTPSISFVELEKEKQKRKELEQKLASLEQEKQTRIEEEKTRRRKLEKKLAALQSEQKKQIKKANQNEIGSGFYVSKFRHIVTNQHVVNKCNKITVGDSISKQIPATLVASDKRNDLAILQTISMEIASAETKSFIQNLSIEIVPIISGGLIRAEDVIGGEEIFVAGYPLGNMVSDSMRLVPGLVNATKGYENDITQFETDASIKKGNSGGPIYDKRGNIVGVAVKRLNVSQSDNFNFAIKGTTVKQFLDANGVITSLANRTSQMSSTDIYKIASKQTVMVVCHR